MRAGIVDASVLQGAAGDDFLAGNLFCGSQPGDVLGSLYCGGPGTDTVAAAGPSHQCIDGGTDADDCSYTFSGGGRPPTPFDIGTSIGCESGNAIGLPPAPCGCP